MTKAQAIYNFWSSFGLKAFDSQSVPDGSDSPSFPYITYETSTGAIGAQMALTGDVWYRSTSWKAVSDKVDEIAKKISEMDAVKIDDGYMYVTIPELSPFSQRLADPDDDMIKRISLNVNFEFLTSY